MILFSFFFQDPDIRFENRLQRFEFISDLYIKHKMGPCKDTEKAQLTKPDNSSKTEGSHGVFLTETTLT